MNLAQALAIAAAAWVTVAAADPSSIAMVHESHAQAGCLAARLEMAVASVHLRQIDGGFSATPDGVRMERAAALR
ncbi:MAG: hypothetical protein ABL871_03215 [Terricaulis sp.]